MQWTATSSATPHLKHCPSSRSQTRFFRFSGMRGSPALVMLSSHLAMMQNSLPPRPRGLEVIPEFFKEGLERRDQPGLDAGRHPIDPLHRPLLDPGDIQPFPGEIVPDRVLIPIDHPALERLKVHRAHLVLIVDALGEAHLD